MLLGVHVSKEGKISETLKAAHELRCNTMQMFSRNPQQWNQEALDSKDTVEFVRKKAAYGINPLFIHVSYLINLASPFAKLYHASINAYIEDIEVAQQLNADYIVTHMGSHKDTSEEEGIERLIKALNTIITKTKRSAVKILLENTSGAGSWLGYNFKHQQKIIQGIKDKNRVGLCLDTAHAYSAGYDIATEAGLKGVLVQIDKLVGLKLIKLIHLNDTKEKLGLHIDRHYHIGKGNIGIEGMRRIINHPKLRDIPFILETPKGSQDDDLMNLKMVRKLRQGG
ncbi:MAG: deoxyribonuclease IV [Candidatus Omnitrophota bacterium]